jgi:hypothetical protein
MKTFTLISLFVLVAVACNNDDDVSNSNQSQVESIAKSGTWRITYFYDTDKDETANYTGYNFTFGSSSVLTATNGANTYTGTWSITDSNSNDDSMDDLHFNIAFTAPPAFEDLSDDWDIIEVTETKIKLIDVSGGNGGTDYLTFDKN